MSEENTFSEYMLKFIDFISRRQGYIHDESHLESWKIILIRLADNVKISNKEKSVKILETMRRNYRNQCDVCYDRCLSVECLRQLFDVSDSEEEDENDVAVDVFYQVFKKLRKYSEFKYNLNELPRKRINGCDLLVQICKRRAMFCGTLLVNKVNKMKIDLEFVSTADKHSLFVKYFYHIIDENINFKKTLCKLHCCIKRARSDLRRSSRYK